MPDSSLNTYSKTLDVADYRLMVEPVLVRNIKSMLGGVLFFDHPHRQWEYGLILNAVRANRTHSILDVGGGGSAFAPTAAWLNMEVFQVDQVDHSQRIAKQASKLGKSLNFVQKDFLDYESKCKYDAVTCISVLEHVLEDERFFGKLLSLVGEGGLVAITVDFHPDGGRKVDGHLRTYTDAGMLQMAGLARERGFSLFRGSCDYTYRGEDVNNYTFASLVMKREEPA